MLICWHLLRKIYWWSLQNSKPSQEHLILRTDFRRECEAFDPKILGASLSTSLDEFLISIVATLKKSNYFTFLQAWHTLGYKHNLHFSIMPLADFCETLISISKSRLSRKTLISFSISTLNFVVRTLILNLNSHSQTLKNLRHLD